MNLSNVEMSPFHISPLVLADRLITLAQDADRAGLTGAANRLVDLAYAVFDETSCRSN